MRIATIVHDFQCESVKPRSNETMFIFNFKRYDGQITQQVTSASINIFSKNMFQAKGYQSVKIVKMDQTRMRVDESWRPRDLG